MKLKTHSCILPVLLSLLFRTTVVEAFQLSRTSSTLSTRPVLPSSPILSTGSRSFYDNHNYLRQCSLSKNRISSSTALGVKFDFGVFTAPLKNAVDKFTARPVTYMLIPVLAAIVGWVTNWLAVQMLFYPVNYSGLSLWRKKDVPLGFIGWQGVVPCKVELMTDTMVEMVTTQLLSVQEVFKRLDPRVIADLLTPEIPKLTREIGSDLFPKWFIDLPDKKFLGFGKKIQDISLVKYMFRKFVIEFTVDMQNNIESCLNLRNCVVDQMLQDRSKLGELFQKVGNEELSFLVNSGLWFGFLLGIIQMIIALFWDNPWTLSVGGTIVGLATNWLALKWIFEPVHPTKFGPWILQGKFLKRQKEVAAVFSDEFANKILTSKKLWFSIFNDPTTSPTFNKLFSKHLGKFIAGMTGSLGIKPSKDVIDLACERAVKKLPDHIGVVHEYVDNTLGLEDTLRTQMQAMTAEKFERVLHPIFEEDELTLIIAGGILGLLAGLVQQGLETGAITIPNIPIIIAFFKALPGRILSLPTRIGSFVVTLFAIIRGKKKLWKRNKRSESSDIDGENIEPVPGT